MQKELYINMKTLKESILSQDIDINDKAMEIGAIWREFELFGVFNNSGFYTITENNIDLDSKGRIIFKDVKGDQIEMDLSYSSWSEKIEEHGFGDIKQKLILSRFDVGSKGLPLSKIRLLGKYDKIEYQGCNLVLDEFPKAKEIFFRECNFRDTHIKARKKPKGVKIIFNSGSYMNYARDTMHYAMGNYVDYEFEKLIIET